MIWFNGVALENVAPVKISDVIVSPITLTAVARQRPVQWGADFVRLTGGERTVTITFALLTEDNDDRQDQLTRINQWALTDSPAQLMVPHHEGRYLNAVCTQLPEPSLRQWWESKLRIVFTAFDPYWINRYEHSAECGTQIHVLGDAPPLMRIERTLAVSASNQSYSDGSNTMTFDSIPAGALVIDLNKQTAAVDGASIMSAYQFGGAFLVPRVGAQTISGTGTVYWRERWK